MIRIDAMWLAVEPIDMRAGADRLLASVVRVFVPHKRTTATSLPMPARAASSSWCTTGSAFGAPHGA